MLQPPTCAAICESAEPRMKRAGALASTRASARAERRTSGSSTATFGKIPEFQVLRCQGRAGGRRGAGGGGVGRANVGWANARIISAQGSFRAFAHRSLSERRGGQNRVLGDCWQAPHAILPTLPRASWGLWGSPGPLILRDARTHAQSKRRHFVTRAPLPIDG